MKIVVNRCFGGFSLSAKALSRLSELQGKPCFHFQTDYSNNKVKYTPCDTINPEGSLFLESFSVPNPNDFDPNELWPKYYINNRPDDRTDPLLIQVVEELGAEADGSCAHLEIVEIPDGISWEIDEYDGQETIHETHRSW